MSRGSKTKLGNAQSTLLSLQESEKLEELLGRRCAVSSELARERAVHCGMMFCCIGPDLYSFWRKRLLEKGKVSKLVVVALVAT